VSSRGSGRSRQLVAHSARRISRAVGGRSPRKSRSNVVLPLPFVRPAHRTRSQDEVEHLEERTISDLVRNILQFNQPFVLRSLAEKSIWAVPIRVLSFKSTRFSINSFALSIRAFDFLVRALAPRRSHSISE